jgi:hypothetical protein
MENNTMPNDHVLLSTKYMIWFDSGLDDNESGFMHDMFQYSDEEEANKIADKYNKHKPAWATKNTIYRVKTVKIYEIIETPERPEELGLWFDYNKESSEQD